MEFKHLQEIQEFTLEHLPDLDVCTLAALELFCIKKPPRLHLEGLKRPLIIGSGNALVIGKILFAHSLALFSDESDYKSTLKFVDSAFLISASGTKHALEIAKTLKEKKLKTKLLTCTLHAPAKRYIHKGHFFLFPKNREPYTYNVSTYLGMILSKTKEHPKEILEFITTKIDPLIPKNLSSYDSFYFIIPSELKLISEMFLNKFDELFGSLVSCRCFTFEQTKHSKTLIPNKRELFISFGYENTLFGESRLNLPLPKAANYAALFSIGYYIIGKIQAQHPPYFKENLVSYTKKASTIFGQEIKPIVE